VGAADEGVDVETTSKLKAELVEFPEKDGRWSLQGEFPVSSGSAMYQLNGTLDELAAVVTAMSEALEAKGAVSSMEFDVDDVVMAFSDLDDGRKRIRVATKTKLVVFTGPEDDMVQVLAALANGTGLDERVFEDLA
jgi:hypothetical protein